MQIDHPEQSQCRRDGCACAVKPEQDFCSDHCRNAADNTPLRDGMRQECECGHDQCNRNEA
jgi:hypothetical protein